MLVSIFFWIFPGNTDRYDLLEAEFEGKKVFIKEDAPEAVASAVDKNIAKTYMKYLRTKALPAFKKTGIPIFPTYTISQYADNYHGGLLLVHYPTGKPRQTLLTYLPNVQKVTDVSLSTLMFFDRLYQERTIISEPIKRKQIEDAENKEWETIEVQAEKEQNDQYKREAVSLGNAIVIINDGDTLPEKRCESHKDFMLNHPIIERLTSTLLRMQKMDRTRSSLGWESIKCKAVFNEVSPKEYGFVIVCPTAQPLRGIVFDAYGGGIDYGYKWLLGSRCNNFVE